MDELVFLASSGLPGLEAAVSGAHSKSFAALLPCQRSLEPSSELFRTAFRDRVVLIISTHRYLDYFNSPGSNLQDE